MNNISPSWNSQAWRIDLELDFAQESVQLLVRDNGCGFSESRLQSPVHFGLTSMRERAKRSGGCLVLESQPNQGPQLLVTVPYECPDLDPVHS